MRVVDGDGTYLVEGGEYVIRELDLCNGRLTHRRDTNAESSNALLR
jgi:hypothetical protein